MRLLRWFFRCRHRYELREFNRDGQPGLWLKCACGDAVQVAHRGQIVPLKRLA